MASKQEPFSYLGAIYDEGRSIIQQYLTDLSLTPEETSDRLYATIPTPPDQERGANNKPADRAWRLAGEIYNGTLAPPSQSSPRSTRQDSGTEDGDASLHRLVTLVVAMKRDPRASEPYNQYEDNPPQFFTTFVWTGRDAQNCRDRVTPLQWRNLHCFFALLWAHDDQPMDSSLTALRTLREALGYELSHMKEENEANDGEQVPSFAPALAYIKYAGDRMYALETEWKPSPISGDPARPGPLLEAKIANVRRGYSKARWAFWKESFRTLAETTDVGSGVMDDAQQAVELMEEVEQRAAQK